MRLLLVVNPSAGSGGARAAVATARPILEHAGCEIAAHDTRAPGDAERWARTVSLDAIDGVVAAGGDGTLHEVVNGLFARGDSVPPLGILPAGTGDALATDLGIPGVERAAEAIAARTQRAIDVARVTVDGSQRFALSVVGWGGFARINRWAERLRVLGRARYNVASALELLRPRRRDSEASRDGQREEGCLLGVACLTPHTGRGMWMAPDAALDDGLADVVTVRLASRIQLTRLLSRVFRGSHVESPDVLVERVSDLRLELDPGSRIVLDGESLPARRVELELLPGALSVFAPPDGSRP